MDFLWTYDARGEGGMFTFVPSFPFVDLFELGPVPHCELNDNSQVNFHLSSDGSARH